jgi:hypothetical protein
MKRPSSAALLPNGFVDLRQAIDIAGRIEYPDEWTGEEVDAEWDWRYRHNLESCAKQMLEDRVKDRSDFGDSLEEIGEEESLETCKSALLEWDEERNRPRQRREGVSVRLRQLLHGGLIPSKALLPSGEPIDIDEYIWAGENAQEIFNTGTVCVENGELRAPGSRGKQPETAYVLLDRQETERAMKGEVPKVAAQSRADVEAKCKRWLKRLIEGSPTERVDSKYNLYAKANVEFAELGHLSQKAFDRAWYMAIEETGAKVWKAAGRPRGN